MKQRSVKKIDLRTEGKTAFLKMYFDDGSELEVKGPRSGLHVNERVENNVVIYDCECEGFEPVASPLDTAVGSKE